MKEELDMDPTRPSSDRPEGGDATDPTRQTPDLGAGTGSGGSWQSTPSTPDWQAPSTPSDPATASGWPAGAGGSPAAPPAWQSTPQAPGSAGAPPAWQSTPQAPGSATTPPSWQSTPTAPGASAPPSWQSNPGAPQGWQSTPTAPGWQQPGAPAWGGASAPAQRPTEVTVASIILMVLGGIGLLISLLILLAGGMVGSLSSGEIEQQTGQTLPTGFDMSAFGAIFGVVGAILLVFSVVYLLGGIGAIRGSGWGRALGLIAAIIGVLFWGLGLLGSIGSLGSGAEGGAGSLFFAVAFFALHAFVLWALAARWRNWGTRTA
jgi:hypothetical protein